MSDAIVRLDHQLLTADEVAELLRLPVSTIYDLARTGRLPISRSGEPCDSAGAISKRTWPSAAALTSRPGPEAAGSLRGPAVKGAALRLASLGPVGLPWTADPLRLFGNDRSAGADHRILGVRITSPDHASDGPMQGRSTSCTCALIRTSTTRCARAATGSLRRRW